MGKPLSAAQKKANKRKLDEAAGRAPAIELPEGEPVPTGLLSREIFDLTAQRKAIIAGEVRAAEVVREFQANLDAARIVTTEAEVNSIVDDTPEARLAEATAQKAEEALRLHFERARRKLKMIPAAKVKAKKRIDDLIALKRIEEYGIIHSQGIDIEQFRLEALEAGARYVAHVCLLGDRQPGFISFSEIMKRLDNKKEGSTLFKEFYAELEDSMGFENL